MRKFLILPLLVLLVACGTLGLPQASSFNQRLAYAYGTHTAVQASAASSLDAKEISSEDAQRVLTVADESRKGLDAARIAFNAGDASTAEGRLQLATALLTELQTYLRKHQ